jgi:hypothetical protein
MYTDGFGVFDSQSINTLLSSFVDALFLMLPLSFLQRIHIRLK